MLNWVRWRSDAMMHLSRRFNRGWAKPDRVSLNLTLRCNLSCTMCTTCYDAPELSLAEIKTIIDQTASWGVEVFNPLGGEPFMRQDIVDILDYAVKKGFYVTITTNGTLITVQRASLISRISSDRLHFNVSLDGDEEINDIIRGPGMYKRAIEGYQRIRHADKIAGVSKRKILSNTILHAHNLDRFERILDEQASLGFDGVQILNLFRSGPDTPEAGKDLWFDSSHQKKLSQLCERLAKRAESQGTVGFLIQNTPHELRSIPRYYSDVLKPLELPCWSGWKELYINSDGEAIMCDGALDFLNGSFGNVKSMSLRELWNSETLRQNRQVVKQCKTPCAQKCYLRPESDSGRKIISNAIKLSTKSVASRLKKYTPGWRRFENVELRIELSDVWPETGKLVWDTLIKDCTEKPSALNWNQLRDSGQVDFGRGFMGFDVLASIVNELHASKIHFSTLILGWRGDPLLHPELESMLHFLRSKQTSGLFDRLRIETSGAFFNNRLLTSHHEDWLFLDIEKNVDSILTFFKVNGSNARAVLKPTDTTRRALRNVMKAFPDCTVVGGDYPTIEQGHSIWLPEPILDHKADKRDDNDPDKRVPNDIYIPITNNQAGTSDSISKQMGIVSWDGKLTKTLDDYQLNRIIADLNHETITDAWSNLLSPNK